MAKSCLYGRLSPKKTPHTLQHPLVPKTTKKAKINQLVLKKSIKIDPQSIFTFFLLPIGFSLIGWSKLA